MGDIPHQQNDIWGASKHLEETFWTPEDMSYDEDKAAYDSLDEEVGKKFKELAAFNAISYRKIYDIESVTLDMLCTIQSPEARSFYSFQIAYETFHIEVYSYIFESVKGRDENDGPEGLQLCHRVLSLPSVTRKREWFQKYVLQSNVFAEKLVAMAVVKLLFSSANSLYSSWFKQKDISMPGFIGGCGRISQDVNIHSQFCSLLYNRLENRLLREDVSRMIQEAVECETAFLKDFTPFKEMGLKEDDLRLFVMWMADRVLSNMKMEKMSDLKASPIEFVQILEEKAVFGSGKRSSAKDQIEFLRSGGKESEVDGKPQSMFALDEEF
eukprot:CAMPEP_0113845002 /NCGR_PEP_ID=MMETSP0372-20130328/527_1 /TAXON_ID=340204 /ORGANISM="Lankesteria abbotti" /LENGTH=325 /DNA_ID=CAMNT_0000814021 /DNA_START=159 /DNA_END=1137 /DNA_ORIENTATION=+ /assembly_acc=CAM_ASM_000359